MLTLTRSSRLARLLVALAAATSLAGGAAALAASDAEAMRCEMRGNFDDNLACDDF
jgi:hypothetical protein